MHDEIKTIIKTHVQEHGAFWPDELALAHDLSVWDVLDAVEELAKEGYLQVLDSDVLYRAETKGEKKNIIILVYRFLLL